MRWRGDKPFGNFLPFPGQIIGVPEGCAIGMSCAMNASILC